MRGRIFPYTSPAELSPPMTLQKKEVKPPSEKWLVSIIIPGAYALATGFFFLLPALVVIAASGNSIWWALGLSSVVMLVMWWWIGIKKNRRKLEELIQKDIDGDGVVGVPGDPEIIIHRYNWRLTWSDGMADIDLPDGVSLEHFVIMCKKFIDTPARTAEADFPTMGKEVVLVRDMFLSRGLGSWVNGYRNQGWLPTVAGRAFCRRVITEYRNGGFDEDEP